MHIKQTIKYLIIVIFLSVFFLNLQAQKEGNIWYFGNKAGLDFSGDYPFPLTNSQMIAPAGCASIADSSGNLLFYSNGSKVWNQNHDILFNGSELFGDSLATMSANILPHPGDSSKFYLFTNRRYPGPDSSYYGGHFYLLDFSVNYLGRIREELSSRTPAEAMTPLATEKFMAIPYGKNADSTNGKAGYWILTHQINSKRFIIYQLDSTLREFGVVEAGSNNSTSTRGYLKANHQGNQFALACWKWVQVFDFDNKTAEITYRFHLYGDNVRNRNTYKNSMYGLEFSPSGRFLYGTGIESGIIYRWEVIRENTRDVRKSTKYLVENPDKPCGSLQLAPDGKIYVALNGQDYLGVIQTPDRSFPRYKENGVRLIDTSTGTGGISQMGLPVNLPSTWKLSEFQVMNTCLGDSTMFYFIDTTGLRDTASFAIYKKGNLQADTIVNARATHEAFHKFPDAGDYRVVLHIKRYENELEFEREVRITQALPINWVDTTLFCSGNDLVLDSGFGAFYEWDDTDERDRIRIVSEQEYPGQEYRVRVTDYNGCEAWDTVYVLKKFSPEVSRVETTKALCGASNGSATVFPVGKIEDFEYYWEEDSTETSNSLQNIPGGFYHVHIINPKTTCARIREIQVPELGGADVQIISSADSIVCPGTMVTLTAINADAYEWLNTGGNTNAQINVTPFSDTTYIVKAFSSDDEDNQCITYAEIHIDVFTVIKPDLGPDQAACSGDSIILQPKGLYETWNWNNGMQGDSLVLFNSQANLILEVKDYNDCYSKDTINIEFIQPPKLEIESTKALCGVLNGTVTVTPDGAIEEFLYFWDSDSTAIGNVLSGLGAGLYSVRVVSLISGCESYAEIAVTELGGPDTKIIPSIDSTICPGTEITLRALNGDSFEWINLSGSTQKEVKVNPYLTTTYILKGISKDDQDNTCTTIVEHTVFVHPITKPDLGEDQEACQGDTIWIDGGEEFKKWNWSNGETTRLTGVVESIQPLSISVADSNSCWSTDDINIVIHPYPEIDLGEDHSVCANQPVELSGGSGDTYLWSTGETSREIQVSQSGIYSLEIIASGCASIDRIDLKIVNPDFILLDSVMIKDVSCYGGQDGEARIFVSVPDSEYGISINNGESYLYDSNLFSNLLGGSVLKIAINQDSVCVKEFSLNPIVGQPDPIAIDYRIRPPSCAFCQDGQITLKEITGGTPPYSISWSDLGEGYLRYNLNEGLYALMIEDSLKCRQFFPIQLEDKFYIPNAFTPNGDGYNDTWIIPVLYDYPDCLVKIFNSKGELIYVSEKGYPKPWDGKSNGFTQPLGTYYYIIQYLNDTPPITGNLTLIR
ncbi:MAG: gliding motility-associated C-terminal domain-containing protein [Bacteroidota bacterium]|nr:gliding motility-associated C-terminal domain-containing protein [Bacteroidota bacterium]